MKARTPRTTVLFIGGGGRNGSTLLERMLAEVPDVAALGEVRHLPSRGLLADERCSCGEPFSACPWWTKVGTAAFGGWDRVDGAAWAAAQEAADRHRRLPGLARLRPGSGDRNVKTVTEHLEALYDGARASTGAPVLVDSSKHASTAALVRLVPSVELRVVNLVRDPRGVAHSWTKVVHRPEAGQSELMPRYRPARTALWWDGVHASLAALRALGVPVLGARYEDLVTDPRGQLARIVDFAGLRPAHGWDRFLSGTTADLGATHSVAGNPMRFRTGRLELRPDVAWREELAARDRRAVTALTAPLLAAYHYPINGRRKIA
ncbi:MAG: sulfotransferase [Actinobacteria bacterium]|nr:sulfotransferase [Actinomycetota bacterium]